MKAFAAAVAVIAIVAGCKEESRVSHAPAPVDVAAHQKEITAWQEKRAERLKAEDSWLTLVGLFWLEEGQNVVTLPSRQTLKLVRRGNEAALVDAAPPMTVAGAPIAGSVPLQSDEGGRTPTIVQMGSIRFQIIKRGDRLGLRVKDAQAPTRVNFHGLEYYPIDAKWRVEARLEPYNPMKKIPIDDVTGLRSTSDSPGALVFTIAGKEYRLDPVLEEGSDELFVIFRDDTAKDETYQAGRYLYAKKPGPDGRTVVDFNKAYNPPCAFTPFATCPLPPPQNRLDVRIEAGEKRYGEH